MTWMPGSAARTLRRRFTVWRYRRAFAARRRRQPPPPRAGDRVLLLTIGGVLPIAIPDGLTEGDPEWEAWFDEAIEAAFDDGRWLDCTAITDARIGFLRA